jgi:L-seryl-tRNA(Ser) seleniumtransferase
MRAIAAHSALDIREICGMAKIVGAARPSGAAVPTAADKVQIDPDIYKSIGVRPLINCRGTFTVIGGSLELPEVRGAMQAAAQHFVQLDELADAVGKRLAELAGAEYGMVSAGCAAAIAHATAACGNPDLHTRLPDLTGFAKTRS